MTAEERRKRAAASARVRLAKIKADPEAYAEHCRKQREKSRKWREKHAERFRELQRKSWRKHRARRLAESATYRKAHRDHLYAYGIERQRRPDVVAKRHARYAERMANDPEYAMRQRRMKRENQRKLRAAKKTVRLCDLDLRALAEHLRRDARRGKALVRKSTAIHGGWRGRIDHRSPYLADNLTAEGRAYARELAAERRKRAEDANAI